jgi:hypothetical protein
MNAFSLSKFLSPTYAWSSLLTLSKLLTGSIFKFLSQPRFQRSCHNLDIGGGLSFFGLIKLSGRVRWTSDAQVAYRRRPRIGRK